MATERLKVWLVGTTWWQGCGELLLQDNCFCKVMAVSQAFIFQFKCYSILHFAVCQLLCWAFLWYLPSNGVIAKIVLINLDLLFEGQKFETVRASIKMHGTSFVDLCYLSSNALIAKNVQRDLDLVFEVKKYETLTYLKWLKLAYKSVERLL